MNILKVAAEHGEVTVGLLTDKANCKYEPGFPHDI